MIHFGECAWNELLCRLDRLQSNRESSYTKRDEYVFLESSTICLPLYNPTEKVLPEALPSTIAGGEPNWKCPVYLALCRLPGEEPNWNVLYTWRSVVVLVENQTENVLYTYRSVVCLVENPTENVLYTRRSVVCLVENHADKVLPDALRAAWSCIPEMSCIPKMSYIPDALSSAWWRTQLKMSCIPDALFPAW